MARIAINGLGRIGRAALKIILNTPDLDLVGVNDATASWLPAMKSLCRPTLSRTLMPLLLISE